MTESEYYASEFADADLDAAADAGDFFLDEWGYDMMPGQEELQELADAGDVFLYLQGHFPNLKLR